MYRKHPNAGKGVSIFFNLGLSFYFMTKNFSLLFLSGIACKRGEGVQLFSILFFTNVHFLHVITQKLGPILKM